MAVGDLPAVGQHSPNTPASLAVAAGCLLAVLPNDHGARQALRRAVEDGAELLPSA